MRNTAIKFNTKKKKKIQITKKTLSKRHMRKTSEITKKDLLSQDNYKDKIILIPFVTVIYHCNSMFFII